MASGARDAYELIGETAALDLAEEPRTQRPHER
jgi:hypothetical protein